MARVQWPRDGDHNTSFPHIWQQRWCWAFLFFLDSQLSQPSLETDLAATFAVIWNGDLLAVAEYSKEGEEAVIFLQQKRAARKETIWVSSCSRGVQR